MSVFQRTYVDLDRALDEMRSLEGEWLGDEPHDVDAEMVHSTSLVLHEWIANLHQYADFQDQSPEIQIHLSYEDREIFCTVVDNSEGFDLEEHLPDESDDLERLPERGMGLRFIRSCTESLSYAPTEQGLQRFEFTIPADHDPWLNTLF